MSWETVGLGIKEVPFFIFLGDCCMPQQPRQELVQWDQQVASKQELIEFHAVQFTV